jgi:hypothetical protein
VLYRQEIYSKELPSGIKARNPEQGLVRPVSAYTAQ